MDKVCCEVTEYLIIFTSQHVAGTGYLRNVPSSKTFIILCWSRYSIIISVPFCCDQNYVPVFRHLKVFPSSIIETLFFIHLIVTLYWIITWITCCILLMPSGQARCVNQQQSVSTYDYHRHIGIYRLRYNSSKCICTS